MANDVIDTSAIAAALESDGDGLAFREAILTLANAIQNSHDDLETRLESLQEFFPADGGIAGVIREIETALGLRDESASAISYCTPVGMLRYGSAELAQRSVNVDETMVSPGVLRQYITGADMTNTDADETTKAIRAYWSIAAALGEATREIDRYLSAVATVPLVAIPMEIRDVCCRIARYRLARYETGNVDESRVYRDYKLDIEWLKEVRDGKSTVNGINDIPPVVAGFRAYSVVAPKSIY